MLYGALSCRVVRNWTKMDTINRRVQKHFIHFMVPGAGLEPARPYGQGVLSNRVKASKSFSGVLKLLNFIYIAWNGFMLSIHMILASSRLFLARLHRNYTLIARTFFSGCLLSSPPFVKYCIPDYLATSCRDCP